MLNDSMTVISRMWQASIVATEGDDSQLRSLIEIVLGYFTGALANTDMRDNIITIQTVGAKVGDFNKDELKQWKVEVQNCVKKNDWVDLICACVSDYRTVGLRSIVTTAALIIPTRPNAASTPLHLSRLLNRRAHSK
jgi:hypothetical protein